MKNTPDGFRPKARNVNIVVQETEAELLLYDLKTNKAFCLNETASKIYQKCDGKKNIAEIGEILNFDKEYVRFAVGQLYRDNLLETEDLRKDFFDSLNRREMLKRAAVNSAIALPLITSILAPKAIGAASATSGCGIQNPPSGSPCPPIDCFSACNGGDFTIVIINGCRTCNCVC